MCAQRQGSPSARRGPAATHTVIERAFDIGWHHAALLPAYLP